MDVKVIYEGIAFYAFLKHNFSHHFIEHACAYVIRILQLLMTMSILNYMYDGSARFFKSLMRLERFS